MDVTLPVALPAPASAAVGALAIMSTSQLLMLVMAVVCLTILLISTRRKIHERQREPRSTARERYRGLEQESKARRDIEEVMLELDQLSRQTHGRLDTKFAKLEAVIRDADDRIERLSRLLRVASREPACDVTLAPEGPDIPAPDSEPVDPSDSRTGIYRLADAGVPTGQIAAEVGKPVGEVELILALRKTRHQAGRESGLVQSGRPSADE